MIVWQTWSLQFHLTVFQQFSFCVLCNWQTADGRPRSFHVKKVHPDTLGWRAGLQALDRIVQVCALLGLLFWKHLFGVNMELVLLQFIMGGGRYHFSNKCILVLLLR